MKLRGHVILGMLLGKVCNFKIRSLPVFCKRFFVLCSNEFLIVYCFI